MDNSLLYSYHPSKQFNSLYGNFTDAVSAVNAESSSPINTKVHRWLYESR